MNKELLSKEERNFAVYLVNNVKAEEAYDYAFKPDRDEIDDKEIKKRANSLAQKKRITNYMREVRAGIARKACWTREKSIMSLVDVVEEPDKKRDIIDAVKTLNSMFGFDAPQKVDTTMSIVFNSEDKDL
jgi:hypothetical protein